MLANFLGVLPILTPPLCALAKKSFITFCKKKKETENQFSSFSLDFILHR
jgi:hypothetical protein